MSDEHPTEPPHDPLVPPPAPSPIPPERARVEAGSPTKRLDALPVLYLVGFVILAAALIYVWRHPAAPRGAAQQAAQQAAKVQTLQQEVVARKQEGDALAARLQKLESKPAQAGANLAPIENRLAQLSQQEGQEGQATKALDQRVSALQTAQASQTNEFKPLAARVDALEQKPAPKPADLGPLTAQVAALEKKESADEAASAAKLDALEKRVAAAEAAQKKTASSLQAIDDRARQAGRLQAASAALAAGQPLGEIPGAPPALAKFAHTAPPTEAGLKASFDTAAKAAEHASQPAIMDKKPFLDRLWTRAQQSVTVRQGDHVLLGDPIAGVIEHARQQLDAGDLAGAIKALNGLAGPAKAAMADWIGQAQSLLDARAAIGTMAAHS